MQATMIPGLQVLLVGFLPVLVGEDRLFVFLGQFLESLPETGPSGIRFLFGLEVAHYKVRLTGAFMEKHPGRTGQFAEMVLEGLDHVFVDRATEFDHRA